MFQNIRAPVFRSPFTKFQTQKTKVIGSETVKMLFFSISKYYARLQIFVLIMQSRFFLRFQSFQQGFNLFVRFQSMVWYLSHSRLPHTVYQILQKLDRFWDTFKEHWVTPSKPEIWAKYSSIDLHNRVTRNWHETKRTPGYCTHFRKTFKISLSQVQTVHSSEPSNVKQRGAPRSLGQDVISSREIGSMYKKIQREGEERAHLGSAE